VRGGRRDWRSVDVGGMVHLESRDILEDPVPKIMRIMSRAPILSMMFLPRLCSRKCFKRNVNGETIAYFRVTGSSDKEAAVSGI